MDCLTLVSNIFQGIISQYSSSGFFCKRLCCAWWHAMNISLLRRLPLSQMFVWLFWVKNSLSIWSSLFLSPSTLLALSPSLTMWKKDNQIRLASLTQTKTWSLLNCVVLHWRAANIERLLQEFFASCGLARKRMVRISISLTETERMSTLIHLGHESLPSI